MNECSYKHEVMLVQQTPLIHFRYYEKDACLRPSELKPKLDRFIFDLFGGLAHLKQEHQEWFVGYHPKKGTQKDLKDALNYKMRVTVSDGEKKGFSKQFENDLQRKADRDQGMADAANTLGVSGDPGCGNISKLYFGNMASGRGTEWIAAAAKSYKETIFYEKPVKITLVCFVPELMGILRNVIADFFLMNNFGTRQNKGFGGFIVEEDTKKTAADIGDRMMQYSKQPVFCMSYNNVNIEKMFNDIATFYSLLKSGNNSRGEYHKAYIYKYYKGKFTNEKRWMKAEGVSPNIVTTDRKFKLEDVDDNNVRYLRAMLGLPGKLEHAQSTCYKKGRLCINPSDKKVINVKDPMAVKCSDRDKNTDAIQRFQSPLLFKVINNCVFIILKDIPKRMYAQRISFIPKEVDTEKIKDEELNSKYTIFTPSSDEFDLKQMLKDYVTELNKLRNKNDLYRQGKINVIEDSFGERYKSYSLPKIQTFERKESEH